MAASQTGMKKRQVIANSNRAMFIWIALASAVIGICAVVGYFMIKQIIFRDTVARRAEATARTLRKNTDAAKELVSEVRKLNTNDALATVRARPDDRPLQVVLDALPADLNTLALGASLQQRIIGEASGVKIETLRIDAIAAESERADIGSNLGKIPFQLSVSATDVNALKDMLLRMERSIRTIDIDTLSLEKSGDKHTLTMTAHAYYQPGKTVELKDEVVKP